MDNHAQRHSKSPTTQIQSPSHSQTDDDGYTTALHEESSTPLISEAECLQRILAGFPDISHEFVSDIYRHHRNELSTELMLTTIAEEILALTKYPTQRQARAQKEQEAEAARSDKPPRTKRSKGMTKSRQYRKIM